ncbi:helix-turn-helix domain-containing protein [Kitasatospora sp. NPDC048365]|uniref:helix-turn-helix domain-containing protein n=1 Tax=Kitasatospora sp. NPDC048365 TaxID=3364050 RepID=UPI00371FE733
MARHRCLRRPPPGQPACRGQPLVGRHRRHLDTTPLAHLRRVRLDAAHRDLLAADPRTTTVTEIAVRWGFAHPGHFAAHYRDAYRTSPSTTLYLPP